MHIVVVNNYRQALGDALENESPITVTGSKSFIAVDVKFNHEQEESNE